MKIFSKEKDVVCKIFKSDETKKVKDENVIAPEEEWIWVAGYKGTDSDMECMGYQYELGKQYDIPDDEDVIECSNGFHLCLTLDDVFGYYSIRDNNRFFKVKALVRKEDFDKYGQWDGLFYVHKRNKLVAKSIEFISECTVDEILSDYNTEGWSDEDKQRALEIGPGQVDDEIIHKARVAELIKHGYSIPFSEYIANDENKYEKACIVASQPDVSMDVKVLTIFM